MTQEWIPVKDRLPEPDTEVLASYDNGTVDTILQWWANGQEPVYEDWYNEQEPNKLMAVLAWMPLPQPYRM